MDCIIRVKQRVRDSYAGETSLNCSNGPEYV